MVNWGNFKLSVEVIRDCVIFALLSSVIDPKNSPHSLNQSDAKLRPITTLSPRFPALNAVWSVKLNGLHMLINLVLALPHLIEKHSNTNAIECYLGHSTEHCSRQALQNNKQSQ